MTELSNRQLEVLSLYAVGKTYNEIGSALFIAYATVETHLKDARAALDAKNSMQAVTICLARGYLCVDHRTELVYVPRPLDDHVALD